MSLYLKLKKTLNRFINNLVLDRLGINNNVCFSHIFLWLHLSVSAHSLLNFHKISIVQSCNNCCIIEKAFSHKAYRIKTKLIQV